MLNWFSRLGALFTKSSPDSTARPAAAAVAGPPAAATAIEAAALPSRRRGDPAAASPVAKAEASRFGSAPQPGEPPAPTLAEGTSLQVVARARHRPPSFTDELFDWLIETPAPMVSGMPMTAGEIQYLVAVDSLIEKEDVRHELLPRAPAVIPKLLNSMKEEHYSAAGVAEHIARDVNLMAEVLRLANSVAYRRGEPVTDIEQAVGRIGSKGLREAIAKVVIKPMFDAPPKSWSGRATPRLWEHSEFKARLCTVIAVETGLDPFAGYLAGLLHNVGWAAAIRMLDKTEPTLKAPFNRAVASAVAQRGDQLFGKIAEPWMLNDDVTELALALSTSSLAHLRTPLAKALRHADRLATVAVLIRDGVIEREDQHWMLSLPAKVMIAFDALCPPKAAAPVVDDSMESARAA
ncbi:MAG: hypothetical protein JWQ11_696 [Rhizobacter sp.]|nr:hypothetical protein [Rhizobacter sp.]